MMNFSSSCNDLYGGIIFVEKYMLKAGIQKDKTRAKKSSHLPLALNANLIYRDYLDPRRPAYPSGCKTPQGPPGKESQPQPRKEQQSPAPRNSIYFSIKNDTQSPERRKICTE
ncbi:hypothetical protein AVEN_68035-1 [Araneus ventricosus]|uniref:Uncharacterized protein n=1 Tax=Araneus ventricosus TaxID=182803 RepID=A0A4Y2M6I0_ARAVE|nr:hypothetical protein AVEN_68035-1 [Araneus ventricosus]